MNPKFGYKYNGNRLVKCENEQLIIKAIRIFIKSGLNKRDIMYILSRHGGPDFYPTNASYSHIYMMCFFPETTDSL